MNVQNSTDMQIYDLDELAAKLKVTKRTLYRFIKSGALKAVKVGKSWRVTDQQLRSFLKV